MESKAEIRKNVLHQLTVKPKSERESETQKLVMQFLKLDEYQNATSIGITISNFPELDTHQLIKRILEDQKKVCCPITLPHHQMDFIEISPDTNFKKSDFGIWEPEWKKEKVNNQPDILIVPGIKYALDTHQRVGFGGGFYDRFLKKFNGHTITLALHEQVTLRADWQIEPTDMSIDQILH